MIEFVAALSEEKCDAAGVKRPWKVRKHEHLEKVGSAPLEARAIVLADKLHNLFAMGLDLPQDDNLWDRFNASPAEILRYHREMVERASGKDESLQPLAAECRRLIAELEQEIDAT